MADMTFEQYETLLNEFDIHRDKQIREKQQLMLKQKYCKHNYDLLPPHQENDYRYYTLRCELCQYETTIGLDLGEFMKGKLKK